MTVLGISAFYHDSAAAIIRDGEIIAAAQEERFTRKKHDAGFPSNAIRFCLDEAGISLGQIDAIAFYDKPLLKFERLLETYYAFAPKGISSFIMSMPVWIREKLFLKKIIKDHLREIETVKSLPKLLFPEHHLSHAASAYYPSPFDESAILTIDGVGEWATASLCYGKGRDIKMISEMRFPHSIGLLYSAFTYYLGFRVNSGEYKLMGLAPYGNDSGQTQDFIDRIKSDMMTIYDDGSLWLNQKYFKYAYGLRMTKDKAWEKLLGVKRRESETQFEQIHCDLALAIQRVTEEVVVKMAKAAQTKTGSKNLCLSGGVALNCVANGILQNEKIFDRIYIQPASGDAGGSLGAALAAYHLYFEKDRASIDKDLHDRMKGAYLGPQIEEKEIQKTINLYAAKGHKHENVSALLDKVAHELSEGKIVGWVQGKMEFGPRALGGRSILGDPRSGEMQKKLNLSIKYRESFRPFAPAVLSEDRQKYFDIDTVSPYMLLVHKVAKDIQNPPPEGYNNLPLSEKLYFRKSSLPAITHVDYSARIQTIHVDTNPRFYHLAQSFKKLTGVGVLVNTSFNVRGEPIVCTAEDAYRCFMRTKMDILVVEDYIFFKEEQPVFDEKDNWKEEFVLD